MRLLIIQLIMNGTTKGSNNKTLERIRARHGSFLFFVCSSFIIPKKISSLLGSTTSISNINRTNIQAERYELTIKFDTPNKILLYVPIVEKVLSITRNELNDLLHSLLIYRTFVCPV